MCLWSICVELSCSSARALLCCVALPCGRTFVSTVALLNGSSLLYAVGCLPAIVELCDLGASRCELAELLKQSAIWRVRGNRAVVNMQLHYAVGAQISTHSVLC